MNNDTFIQQINNEYLPYFNAANSFEAIKQVIEHFQINIDYFIAYLILAKKITLLGDYTRVIFERLTLTRHVGYIVPSFSVIMQLFMDLYTNGLERRNELLNTFVNDTRIDSFWKQQVLALPGMQFTPTNNFPPPQVLQAATIANPLPTVPAVPTIENPLPKIPAVPTPASKAPPLPIKAKSMPAPPPLPVLQAENPQDHPDNIPVFIVFDDKQYMNTRQRKCNEFKTFMEEVNGQTEWVLFRDLFVQFVDNVNADELATRSEKIETYVSNVNFLMKVKEKSENPLGEVDFTRFTEDKEYKSLNAKAKKCIVYMWMTIKLRNVNSIDNQVALKNWLLPFVRILSTFKNDVLITAREGETAFTFGSICDALNRVISYIKATDEDKKITNMQDFVPDMMYVYNFDRMIELIQPHMDKKLEEQVKVDISKYVKSYASKAAAVLKALYLPVNEKQVAYGKIRDNIPQTNERQYYQNLLELMELSQNGN